MFTNKTTIPSQSLKIPQDFLNSAAQASRKRIANDILNIATPVIQHKQRKFS